MTPTRWTAITKILVVVVATSGLAAVLHLGLLLPWLGRPAPPIFVVLAVVASAAYGGFWAGLLATAIGATVAAAGFGLHAGNLLALPDELVRLALLVSGCVVAAVLAGSLRRARQRSGASRRAVAREIGDRQLAQQRLMASEARFRELVESLPDITFVADARGVSHHANRRWFEFSGQSDRQDGHEHWAERVHPGDRERVLSEWTLAVNTEMPLEARCRLRGIEGGYLWFLVRARPVRGVITDPVQWFVVATNIDAQMRAEAALRDREEQLRLALESTGLGVFELEFWTRRLMWSDRCRSIWGFAADEPLSIRAIRAGVHPHDRRRAARALLAVRDPGGSGEFALEFRVVRPDGELRWVAARGCAFFVTTGDGERAIRCIGTMLDFTERRSSEEMLRRSERSLREADRRKDDFLAILAHELRNPLAPMRHALQLLDAGAGPETARYARGVLERQLEQMVRLIDDLLDVARIASGKLALQRRSVLLTRMVDNAVETVAPLMRERHHELHVDVPAEPVELDCDEARISQVLSNLLNNAARYTPVRGIVELAARADDDEVVFEVKDNGVGIAPESLDSIFDMFAQGGVTPAEGHTGLGVGLPLSRSLVALHDGRMEVKSGGQGRGTAFTVRLPRAVTRPPAPEATPGQHVIDTTSTRRILVVDDNRDAADTLGELLRIAGHETRVCHSGLHALALAESFRPDLVLLDIGMPRIDGHEVARRLRAQPWGREMRIVALSGFGRPEDRRRSLEAGCDDHLTKPVTVSDLRRALSSAADAADASTAVTAGVPAR